MDQKEKFVAILGAGIGGLIVLAFGVGYVLKSGYRPELTAEQLQYGFFHAVFLLLMAIFGWFSALRVGAAIPTMLKVTVLATTAVLYYWATKLWIPLIIRFFTETLPTAGTGGISKGVVVFTALLAAFIIMAFLIPFTKGAFKR